MNHRASDPPEANFSRERVVTVRPFNGNLKWVLALVFAVLGALATAEWRRIDGEAGEALDAARKNELTLATVSAQLVQIQSDITEIKQAVKSHVRDTAGR